MIRLLNRFIAIFLVPLLTLSFSPFMLVKKHELRPSELISLSENGVGNNDIFLTAHRGVTATAPENTLPAYEEAIRLGYYSAECDIRLTQDKVWVLAHNDKINSRFWQFGKISEIPLSELQTYQYQYGTQFWKYDGLRIPTLDEYLDLFIDAKTRPQIEIKSEGTAHLESVVDAVKKKGLEARAIIISFDAQQLHRIHELDPKIELWYLLDEITPDSLAQAKAIGGHPWLSANYESNNSASIVLAQKEGFSLSFWTVNTIEDAKLLYDSGVRYIETDILKN